MARNEWNDDEQYQAAPLPAHEREWRHPSEIGEQVWLGSEPPLTIGRGLTVATGAIGGLFALAVLWTMLPTQAGRNAALSVRSTLANRVDGVLNSESSEVQLRATVDSPRNSAAGSVSVVAPTTAPLLGAVSTVSSNAIHDPVPTYQLQQGTVVAEVALAVAVAVNGGRLVLTTAHAVTTDSTVELMLPDGTISTARVLFVDDRSGLAVLAPASADDAMAFTVATAVEAGDELTFVDLERTVTVTDQLTISADWTKGLAMAEGAPVINQRGELVALCTRDADGTRLVQLARLDQLLQSLGAYQSTATVWLGVLLNDDPDGELSIGAVDPAGPAARAGLTSGDILVGLDDKPLTDGAALTAALATHAPGDQVRIDVRHADGTVATVTVRLATPKTAL